MAAGYQKPLVLVYQEFARLSPSLGNPELAACIIGPAYSILTIEDDKDIIRAGFFEYDYNANVTVPRKGVSYPNTVTLYTSSGAAVEGKTPPWVLTFTDITDFYTKFDIKAGTPGVGESWYELANQNLTLTYNEGVDYVRTQTLDLGSPVSAVIARTIYPVSQFTTGTLDLTSLTAATIEIDAIDFEAADPPVEVGDTLVFVAPAGDTCEASVITITGVSGTTLTYNHTNTPLLDPNTGVAYLLADDGNFATDYSDAGADATTGLFYIYSADSGETAANSIYFQPTIADVVAGFKFINPNVAGGATGYTGSTAGNFGNTDLVGGNYIVWDSSITTVDASVFTIPNPDAIPGLELVTASTKVYFDDATVIVAGGIGRVQGTTNIIAPTDAVEGEFGKLSRYAIQNSNVVSDTAITGGVTTVLNVDDTTIFSNDDDDFFTITDGTNTERVKVASFVADTSVTLAVAPVSSYPDGVTISVEGYDTITHEETNFELLGILEGDSLYIEFPLGGSKTFYNISRVSGKSITVDGIKDAAYGTVFMGILDPDGVPYSSYIASVDDVTDTTDGTPITINTVVDLGPGTFAGVTIGDILTIEDSATTNYENYTVITPTATTLTADADLAYTTYADNSTITHSGRLMYDMATGGQGVYSVFRGGLSCLAITARPGDTLVDTDVEPLVTFTDGEPTPGDLGFFTPHIHVEPGDDVFIGRTTTGVGDSGNALNATYSKHKVFSVGVDRLVLTSPIVVPYDDRTSATVASEINDTVQFYVQKSGQTEMLMPISGWVDDENETGANTGYVEDADDFTVTVNTASISYDPRYLTGTFQSDVPAVGTYVTIDDEGNVNENNVIKGNIVDGIVYIGSTSLRTDLSNQLLSITNTNEVEGTLGKIIPENPLAFGVFKCLQASATVAVRAYAVAYHGTDQIAESVEYQKAYDYLTGTTEVYGLVPLTRTKSVLTALKSHVEAMSAPEKAGWRIGFINNELPTEKMILDRHGAVSKLTTNVTIIDLGLADHRRVQDAGASFVSDGVSAGMKLKLFYDTDDFSVSPLVYTIDTVNSETLLTVTESITDAAGDAYAAGNQAIGTTNYEIIRELNSTEQANDIAATSRGYGTRRIINVWPDTVEIGGLEVPGYYQCCVTAGMVANLPAHAGLTRIGIPGIDKVVHSNDYFTDAELDIIAGGGTFIYVQNSASAPIYSRHQLTTDRSFVEVQELNVVKNLDFMSYFFKGLLEPFIGVWNVTDEVQSAIARTLSSGIAFQEARVYPKIGAALRPGLTKIISIEESSISSDRIEIYMDIALPRPLNVIGLHLVV